MKRFRQTKNAAHWLIANASGPATVLMTRDRYWTVPDITALARTPWVWGL